MIEAGLAELSRSSGNRSVERRYALACAAVALLALALGFALTQTVIGAVAGLVAFVVMAAVSGRALARHYPHSRLGIANLVTLARTGIIAALFAPLTAPEMLAESAGLAWTVFGIAVFSLSLDGVDGYFARRQKLTSDFGARFDMEIDSVFALLLAVLAWQSGKAGPWVLLLGGMRYGFVAASVIWPWLLAPLPERFSRKAICVIQIAILIAMLMPIVSGPLSWAMAGIGTLALLYSFGRDVIWLAGHRS